jgi:hypothetical protein
MMRTGRQPGTIRARRFTVGLLGLAAMSLAACGDDSGELACVELDLKCDAAFDPTFVNVYKFVISPSCAAAGCHDAKGVDGLSMSTEDEAYKGLVDGVGGKPRVIKGDASCSILTERIETEEIARRMPLMGDQLSEKDRCAIEQWIEAGAPR